MLFHLIEEIRTHVYCSTYYFGNEGPSGVRNEQDERKPFYTTTKNSRIIHINSPNRPLLYMRSNPLYLKAIVRCPLFCGYFKGQMVCSKIGDRDSLPALLPISR